MKRKSQTKNSKVKTQKLLDAAHWHTEMFAKYGEDYDHLSEKELIARQQQENDDIEQMKEALEKMRRDTSPPDRRHRNS